MPLVVLGLFQAVSVHERMLFCTSCLLPVT